MTTLPLRKLLHTWEPADSWATPSLLPDQPVLDLRLDQSISNDRLGSPLSHDGPFAAIEQEACEARGSDRAWALTNGSTLGNQVAMGSLVLRPGQARVLAAANCHHSVLQAACTTGVELRYLEGRMVSGFNAMLPPTPAEVATALDADPAITAVWISSPTYEGIVADVEGIADVVHARDALLVVDSAWGSHFGFHPELPPATATLGADLVIESTHKNGGGLQGTALLLASGGRVDPTHVDTAYHACASTSQSFLLMASLEWALHQMHVDGKRYLEVPLAQAAKLRLGLAERGVPLLVHPALADLTKVTFGGLTDGYEVGRRLLDRRVVIEKSSIRSVTMLATMQLREGAADRALRSLDQVLRGLLQPTRPGAGVELAGWLTSVPEVEAPVAYRAERTRVPLAASVGRVAAEMVELYPPGIPVLAPGWRITRDAVDALLCAEAAGATVVSTEAHSVAVLTQ